MLSAPPSVPDSATRPVPDALRQAVQRLERGGAVDLPALPLGVPEIDAVLPGGGLRRGCVHEVSGDEAATGFCAALLARAGAHGGELLWLARGCDLHPPGLVRYGIAPGRLLVVSGLRRSEDVAWAMEEALRSGAVKGVVAESSEPVGLAASRRLMLAAEGSDVLGLVLSASPGVPTAVSRWRVTGVPSGSDGNDGGGRAVASKWRIKLLRCRGGRPAEATTSWGGDG